MTFLAPGTPITRDTIDQALEATALACAIGVRQHSTVLYLIEHGEITTKLAAVPAQHTTVSSVFPTGLQYSSWRGLRKRLTRAGFKIISRRHEDGSVTYLLTWGEAAKP